MGQVNEPLANLNSTPSERDTLMPAETIVATATTPRPHAQRLLQDLKQMRADLKETVRELGPDRFEWEPRPGMRTCKNLLIEIGTMDALSRGLASRGELLSWNTVWNSLDKGSMEETLVALDEVRAETIAYLESVTEEQLETPIPLPEAWQEYFDNAKFIEPEELINWIARNEYYHYGQLNTYAFLLSAA
jgi:hypothetical protein